ncbi:MULTISPECIES: 2-amino-4-hydroxy-6-hydroxymethyldihydropteridine diphosphokinase [unclassified Streptomyces]|uniref:2-amino-4-hydroxy-6- hydroxymethyldihydropteridine diphosphokinase n=1 Tax=unclassified Streptomyces TaxID=2593676 RepID=UPI00300A87CB
MNSARQPTTTTEGTAVRRPQPGDPTVQPVPASVVEQVDAADVTLSNPKRAVISLGSNLGNRLETLQGAVDALEDTPGLRVKAVSPVYETEPWGVAPGSQPTYFNAVVLIKTTLPPASLLERGHAIEEAFERVRDEQWGPRTIDVDIVAYQDVLSDDPRLTLPHPRAHERAFVLAPWHDIDPEAEVPGHGPVAALLSAVGRDGVAPRADLELRLPE